MHDQPSVMMENKKSLKQSNDVTDSLSIFRYYYILHNGKFDLFKPKLLDIFFDAFTGFATPGKSTVSAKFKDYDNLSTRVKTAIEKAGF